MYSCAKAREHRRIYHRDSTIDSTLCHRRGRCDMEVEKVVCGISSGGGRCDMEVVKVVGGSSSGGG